MRVSKNFTRNEFTCECGCGFETVDIILVNVLEKVRLYCERTFGDCYIYISGGNRCFEHNSKTTGAMPNSKHVAGIAADFKVFLRDGRQIPERHIYNYLEIHYPNTFGIGRYSNRTHLDVRASKARWDYRNK